VQYWSGGIRHRSRHQFLNEPLAEYVALQAKLLWVWRAHREIHRPLGERVRNETQDEDVLALQVACCNASLDCSTLQQLRLAQLHDVGNGISLRLRHAKYSICWNWPVAGSIHRRTSGGIVLVDWRPQ